MYSPTGSSQYDSYEELFIYSTGAFPGTAVKNIHEDAGVPMEKIVVGKPARAGDATNTGLVTSEDLGTWAGVAY